MVKRVTVMIEDNLDKKIRMLQAKQITQSMSSASFSSVVNSVLCKGLK